MSTAAGSSRAKAAARIALLGVDAASASVLKDCFGQFGVETAALAPDAAARVATEFNACIVPLTPQSEAMLQELRQSNRSIVIYGICGSIREAMPYAKWGVNAVFYAPVTQNEALQVVRSTHLLLVKELRRYVRVPLVIPILLETGTQVLEASSMEISAGGMLLTTKASLTVPQGVLASFCLPGASPTSVRCVVCWTRDEEGTAAIRFEPSDTRRTAVRDWIDEYLGA